MMGPVVRLYRALLRLLPTGFRRRHADDMEEVFRALLEQDLRRGPVRGLSRLAKEVVDVLATALRLRVSGWISDSPRVAIRRRLRTAAARLGHRVFAAARAAVSVPASSVLVVATLALGVGPATATLGLMDGLMLRPLPYEEPDRLLSLWRSSAAGSDVLLTPNRSRVVAWRARTELFEGVEPVQTRVRGLTGGEWPTTIGVGAVRPGYLDVLGVSPMFGRGIGSEDVRGNGARVVLLGRDVWESQFGGDSAILGRRVELDGDPYDVIGILPSRHVHPVTGRRDVGALVPLGDDVAVQSLPVVARLREGVELHDVEAELGKSAPGAALADRAGVPPVTARRARVVIGAAVAEPLRMLVGASTVLLLLAVVNVVVLRYPLNSRSGNLGRTTGPACNAGPDQPGRDQQPRLLLAAAAGGLGIGIAWILVKAIGPFLTEALPSPGNLVFNGRVLAFGMGIPLVLVPVLERASRMLTERTDPEGRDRKGYRDRVSWTLAVEAALACALLLGAGAAAGLFLDLEDQDPGFRPERKIALKVSTPACGPKSGAGACRSRTLERIKGSLERLPGVSRVVRSTGVPPRSGIFVGGVRSESHGPAIDADYLYGSAVEPGYFELLEQRILAGRSFDGRDVSADPSVVVLGDGTARRLFPDEDAVGRRIRQDGEWLTVVGVAEDVAQAGLSQPKPKLQMYRPFMGNGEWMVLGVERSARNLVPAVRRAVRGVEPEAALLELAPMRQLLRSTLVRERATAVLLAVFAGLASVLSAVAVFALLLSRPRRGGHDGDGRIGLKRGILPVEVVAPCLIGVAAGTGLALLSLSILDASARYLVSLQPRTIFLAASALLTLHFATAWMAERARYDDAQGLFSLN